VLFIMTKFRNDVPVGVTTTSGTGVARAALSLCSRWNFAGKWKSESGVVVVVVFKRREARNQKRARRSPARRSLLQRVAG
jgi:hypothetical protein